jgi:hypothetical protein
MARIDKLQAADRSGARTKAALDAGRLDRALAADCDSSTGSPKRIAACWASISR